MVASPPYARWRNPLEVDPVAADRERVRDVAFWWNRDTTSRIALNPSVAPSSWRR